MLPKAFEHPGWVLGDPHSHGSPSSDGALPMEDRLIVHAGVGLQVHFGTDHDHLADYRPLLAPLGLDLDAQGFITVDRSGLTSAEGVWAAGNVVDPRMQVITSAGAGAAAAIAINADLVQEDVTIALRAGRGQPVA